MQQVRSLGCCKNGTQYNVSYVSHSWKTMYEAHMFQRSNSISGIKWGSTAFWQSWLSSKPKIPHLLLCQLQTYMHVSAYFTCSTGRPPSTLLFLFSVNWKKKLRLLSSHQCRPMKKSAWIQVYIFIPEILFELQPSQTSLYGIDSMEISQSYWSTGDFLLHISLFLPLDLVLAISTFNIHHLFPILDASMPFLLCVVLQCSPCSNSYGFHYSQCCFLIASLVYIFYCFINPIHRFVFEEKAL